VVAVAGLSLATALVPGTATAQFARYIEAYNTLARAVNERMAASGVGGPVPLRIVGKGESFNTLDLETLRFKVLTMLQNGFLSGPSAFNLSVADPAGAFPMALRRDAGGDAIGPHLMTGVGDGKGRFTRVPGEYMSSGQTFYSANSWEHPVLWVHFKELQTVLERMRYTPVQDGPTIGWLNAQSASNQLSGWASGINWMEARDDAWASYGVDGPQPAVGPPESYMTGLGPRQGFPCYAGMRTRWAQYVISGLYTGVSRGVTLYLRSARPSGATPPELSQFDACGMPVIEGRWIEWCATPGGHQSTIVSTSFGGERVGGDCLEPAWQQTSIRGYRIDNTRGCVEWDFAPIVLTQPLEAEDADGDGLSATGCECVGCPPAADPEWKAMCADTRVRLPLGMTSGLLSGGLRLKAYLTEYIVNGATQQMYSLNTRVMWAVPVNNGLDQSEFVAMKRPSGAEVLFSVLGSRAGAPVESRRTYRLRRESGYVILSFPASGNVRLIEHKFYLGWLAYVTMKVGSSVVVADGSTGYGRWPGFSVAFVGSAVQQVDSPAVQAFVTAFDGDLVRTVELRYRPAGPTNTLFYYPGSRGFRTLDEAGRTVSDVRIVEDPEGGVEIWQGLTSGAQPVVPLKTRRTGWLDAASGCRMLAETTIANDGRPDADSTVIVTAMADFPWGTEEISRTVAYGLPEAQTTRYTYGTNILDSATYGRLSLEEDPDGFWTAHEYDSRGRPWRVRTPWRSSRPDETNACRVTEYVYAGDPALAALGYPAETVPGPDDRPRLTVERLGGHEVLRRYAAYAPWCETTKECLASGAAYDDPDNRATVTRFMTDWPFAGRPAGIEHPDGTRTAYSYAWVNGGLAITEDHGVGSGAAVTNGTRFVKRLDSLERVASETRSDIASGLTLGTTDYTFDGLGRVLCVSNALTGEATVNTYGCCGPERVQDGAGVVTATVYDDLKRPYAVERLGVTTYQSYDVNGQVVETRRSAPGEADIVTRMEYDKAGRLRRSTDERGFVTTHSLQTNAAGERVVTVCGPDGATAVETYYRDGRVKSVSGTGVAPVCFEHGADEQGTFTLEYRGPDTNAAHWVRTTTDRLGRGRSVAQADGYTRTTQYDAQGRPSSESDGRTRTLFMHDALGAVSRQAVDMDGNGTADAGGTDRLSETETGYVLQEGRPARRTVTRVWDTVGSGVAREIARSVSTLDGRTSWSIAFDRTTRVDVVRQAATAERRETTVAADGTRTVAQYTNGLLDSLWRETAQGARITTRRQSYDAFGRLARVDDTGPNGTPRILTYRYDAAGNVTNTIVEAAGRRLATAHVYDEAGRLVQVLLPDGGVVSYGYEPHGALSSQSGTRVPPVRYGYDGQGRMAWQATYRAGVGGAPDVTRWIYDAQRGWLTERVYADGTSQAYAYNPNGSLRHRTSARGGAVDHEYDPAGGVTNTRYADGTAEVSIRRDRLGRPVEVLDGAGVRTYEYRTDGLPSAETFPLAGVRVSWAYDAFGRRTNMSVSALAGGGAEIPAGYGYDAAGRLARATWGAHSADYRYADDGLAVAGVTLAGPGGTALAGARTYDGLGRWTNLAWTVGGAAVAGFGYGHDDAGRRTNCVLADGRTWAYMHDSFGQVVAARLTDRENGLEPEAVLEYGYDTVGNRTQMQDNGRLTTYTANALNQYTGFDLWGTGVVARACGTVFTFGGSAPGMGGGGGGGGPFGAEPAYDADGNLVRIADTANGGTNLAWGYAWDAENRCIQASNEQCRVSFTYDSMGRRVAKTVFVKAAGAWVRSSETLFVYDGWNVIQEVTRRNSDVSTNRYHWGLDLSGSLQGAGGIGGLLGILTSDSCLLTSVCDANGNVTGLIDTNGVTVATYDYGPFGEVLGATGPAATANPWRFSTRYTDPETGLVMYPRRPYSPTLGRWLSRDPIEEAGGLNLYGFVGNGPVNAVDPLGLALYAFDGTWNDYEKMKRPTNVRKLFDRYTGLRWYEEGVGTAWYSRHIGGMTGAGGGNRIESMYNKLVDFYSTPDSTGENQKIDVIGFSRGAALARTFVNYINRKGGVTLRRPDGKPTGLVCPVRVRFLGLFDTVGSFGILPGNNINPGHDFSIPANVENVRHAVALDEKRGMFPLSSVLSDPSKPFADPRIVEQGFRGAHSDIGGGYEDGDRSNFALMWMHDEGVSVGVPFGPLKAGDLGASNPVFHDERGPLERWRDRPREIYYLNSGR
jgi:RHS repeat-associated protein